MDLVKGVKDNLSIASSHISLLEDIFLLEFLSFVESISNSHLLSSFFFKPIRILYKLSGFVNGVGSLGSGQRSIYLAPLWVSSSCLFF